ncbi:hypothetical protein [Streptomyces sp. A1547]|uniref:hypothetical protein n=1 Tax=Streptomyces sp. A1547 TaxID=2563105 RepID=UPI00109E4338|nr:hypothetical protein [Streptomyces sp. A1547]THA32667.1 hypothetical protein E6W17_33355 [Streptomyces sp. A1547]
MRSTLEELVSAVAESTLPGDPEYWDNLSYSSYADGKYILIDFNHLWASVSISGPDLTWVHGQAARLKAILAPASGEEAPWRRKQRIAAGIGVAAAALVWPSAYFILRDVTSIRGSAVTLSCLIVVLLGFAAFIIGTSGKGGVKRSSTLSGKSKVKVGGRT